MDSGKPEPKTESGDQKIMDGDEIASEVLHDVANLINDDRDSHGDAVRQHRVAANLWTAYFQGIGLLQPDQSIDSDQVARCMDLLKTSRSAVGEYDIDSDRDGAGYSGIAAACSLAEGKTDSVIRDD